MKNGLHRVLLLAAAVALGAAGCDGTDGTDGGATEDAGETSMDSGMSSTMDGGDQPGADGGGMNDAGNPDAGGGPTTRMALPNGGITTLGPRSSSGTDYRVFDEGFETDQQRCAGTVCVSGSIRP